MLCVLCTTCVPMRTGSHGHNSTGAFCSSWSTGVQQLSSHVLSPFDLAQVERQTMHLSCVSCSQITWAELVCASNIGTPLGTLGSLYCCSTLSKVSLHKMATSLDWIFSLWQCCGKPQLHHEQTLEHPHWWHQQICQHDNSKQSRDR